MAKPLLIIQNDAHEGAGLLATLAAERGRAVVQGLAWELDYAGLQPGDFAGLVMLGGSQGAYETDSYPYLADEIALARAFVAADKPVLGLCLGAQLLAVALDGQVHSNTQKEIGFGDITLSEYGLADPLLAGLPASHEAFHFHGDYVGLPPGCVNLASSDLTACQLFRHGDSRYGFQYHAEIDGPLLEIMCRNGADYMAANGFDADTVIASAAERLAPVEARDRQVLGRWLDRITDEGTS